MFKQTVRQKINRELNIYDPMGMLGHRCRKEGKHNKYNKMKYRMWDVSLTQSQFRKNELLEANCYFAKFNQ